MKAVFKYESYSDYLRDYVEFKRTQNKHWSISSWAKELRLSTTSSLTNIIQGRRPPSHEMAKEIADSITEISDLERVYFLLMIELAKSSLNVELSDSIRKRMAAIRPRNSFRQITDQQLSKIANWYSYAIREMVNLKDFKHEPSWISKRLGFGVSEEDVEKSIDSLLSIGLLRKDEHQHLAVASDTFETSTDVTSNFLKKYHKSFLKLAIDKIEASSIDERHYTSTTISLRKEDLLAAKMFIENTRREFVESFDRPGGDEIYHLSLIFFPVTKSFL